MRLSSWSQNACFVHTAIRSAVAPNNDGEIQNTDLSFNHFWFRSTFADDPVWVLCSSRWNPASSHMLTACVSWKRLQVFFFFPPRKHYRSSFSAELEEHNVRGDDWTMFLCQTHCRWCREDNMEDKLSFNSGKHTLILFNTLWYHRLSRGRANVLLSEGRWFSSPGLHVEVSLGKILKPKTAPDVLVGTLHLLNVNVAT